MKKYLLYLLCAVLSMACSAPVPAPKSGDLLFVGIPSDYSLDADSMDAAVSAATGRGGLNLIHVAIVEVDEADSLWVIDATIRHGVDRHPFSQMKSEFKLKDGSDPVYVFKRVLADCDFDGCIARAKSYCGLPYDEAFLPDNAAMYCSELVQECYLGPDGSRLFDSAPMNFKDAEGNMPLYWEQLFARLGTCVPQGIPGTNPQAMAASELLKEVMRIEP